MTYYTDEKHTQIVISLLKGHGIRQVIASPGTTNMAFVGSVQNDPFFNVHSAVDERSAAYMACGLAAETGEPVVLSCTGATASRNYLPGLTEAYYRKLPVLALTSMQGRARAGHLVAQVIDRSSLPCDTIKLSLDLPLVQNDEEVWECEMKVNRALLEMRRHGGGPVHINLPTNYSQRFPVRELPTFRVIKRWTADDDALPALAGRIGVFVGAHKTWTPEETAVLDRFCEANDAVVFCDHSSGYHGKYRILGALLGGQHGSDQSYLKPDILIHIGEVSGDYDSGALTGRQVWRVNPDGEIRDTFRKLKHVFEMSELRFFRRYGEGAPRATDYFQLCKTALDEMRAKIPELPFSNLWLASQFADHVPEDAVVHFAILNSLRAWNFFDLPAGVRTASNVGGFGIDGCMSSLIGASLADPDRLYYLVTGDLAFFYDMNSLGNRHLGPNVRILLVNNGKGTEFTQYGHAGSTFSGDADKFIAADGHFGSRAPDLGKYYAQGLGLDYIRVSGKQESDVIATRLFSSERQERPMLVEVIVDPNDESEALRTMRHLDQDNKTKVIKMAKRVLGPAVIRTAKQILRR
jgi:2-succinyl-5-enolpyruvyl-6-hydroxy-3-cyclohexene-1-carboxylate synthase